MRQTNAAQHIRRLRELEVAVAGDLSLRLPLEVLIEACENRGGGLSSCPDSSELTSPADASGVSHDQGYRSCNARRMPNAQ